MNSKVSQSRAKQFRHTCEHLQASDVITYPLAPEMFAFLERDLECEIDRQKIGVDFEAKQI